MRKLSNGYKIYTDNSMMDNRKSYLVLTVERLEKMLGLEHNKSFGFNCSKLYLLRVIRKLEAKLEIRLDNENKIEVKIDRKVAQC